ncbi:MAG: MotA/TolQ/ExbB proton channel family protein [Planctomyces sp.]|nr:MotA/TolQ/ExbB proton channel family protein [Planctomyces sp.]
MVAKFNRRRAAVCCLIGALVLLAWPVPGPLSGIALAQEGAAAPEQPGAPDDAPEAHTSQHPVIWFLWTSGPIGAFIFLLSIYFIATVTRLFKEIRMPVAMPPEIVAEARVLIEKRNFKGVYALVKEDNSHFSQVLRAGLTELPSGLSESREAMEMVSDVLHTEDDKKISMLAVLGTLGPMIGLLGTLVGMIKSFAVIAINDTQIKASQVAEGISEALLLTLEGVALSVPAIYFFAVFRNRVSTISANVLLTADEMIRALAAAAKGRTPPASATATTTVVNPPPQG